MLFTSGRHANRIISLAGFLALKLKNSLLKFLNFDI
jgi:hypothetical protein